MEQAQVENLLGAMSLALAGAQEEAARKAAGLGPSGAAALVVIGFYPDTSIGTLAGILGLTHSVVVRLVEGLAADGLVERAAAPSDRRQVVLRLSAAGRARHAAILEARRAALAQALAPLDAQDVAQFGAMLARLLTGLTTGRLQADHMCRLCDENACPGERCPVECEAVRISGIGSPLRAPAP
ncbi:MarR family winged helix-turn-helix transcriptional regulator [Xanthobacter sp. VTT E-85241]|uniref:MarR family winged helix-turn-helix transcriptional regulator n=1 Tax=Roseixanthobacter finlandensis TaxID=3119922 RepID=UPI003726B70C